MHAQPSSGLGANNQMSQVWNGMEGRNGIQLSQQWLSLSAKGNLLISQSYSINRPVIHNPDTAVKIQVHPGDFEWLREVYLWVEWIEKNLGVDKNNFDVYSNKLL